MNDHRLVGLDRLRDQPGFFQHLRDIKLPETGHLVVVRRPLEEIRLDISGVHEIPDTALQLAAGEHFLIRRILQKAADIGINPLAHHLG